MYSENDKSYVAAKTLGSTLAAVGFGHYLYLLESNYERVIATIGIGCVTTCYWYYNKCMYSELESESENKNISTNKKPFVEVIFFPDEITIGSKMSGVSREMRGMMYKNILYGNATQQGAGLQRLKYYISSAKKSLDVCLFNITSEQLTKYVTDKIDDGVKVRLIVDGSVFDAAGGQIEKFLEAGAFVRSSWTPRASGDNGIKNGDYLMHHKFAIIDSEIVMTGSFNWTMQAIMGNNENVIITSETEVVSPFISEFEKLWSDFDPNRLS